VALIAQRRVMSARRPGDASPDGVSGRFVVSPPVTRTAILVSAGLDRCLGAAESVSWGQFIFVRSSQ